ncbi:MSMEG_1061 family FMN-dependent PPOX-type flavoprotein [Amycolatopsis jejuensis]|uniref:MSMEG_1061 family FMN-dependent PPOX-type flavoprotein n=1 Tax=Amycolatopsis jejuensis TaxID=330084 RepID=UPI0005273597|nr:MSMEG_1061 family FMN-dependent PPOX-type flavoprotein [Amycolatopsis jejuensis]
MTSTAADAYTPITMDRVREIIGFPEQFIAEKKEPRLGEFAMRFIAHSPFFCVASFGADGLMDVGPKGDPPGSVRILDPWTLAIPDRPGNKFADTFENITVNPSIGLVFFVPGLREVMRVNGDAFVTDDPELLGMLGADGKPAALATIVRVREVFGQCGKAVIRAKLWEGDTRGLANAVTLGGDFYTLTIAEHAQKMNDSLGELVGGGLHEAIDENYRNELF